MGRTDGGEDGWKKEKRRREEKPICIFIILRPGREKKEQKDGMVARRRLWPLPPLLHPSPPPSASERPRDTTVALLSPVTLECKREQREQAGISSFLFPSLISLQNYVREDVIFNPREGLFFRRLPERNGPDLISRHSNRRRESWRGRNNSAAFCST